VKFLHHFVRFANVFSSLQVFPSFVISSSLVLLQVLLGRRLLLAPWGFQSNNLPLSLQMRTLQHPIFVFLFRPKVVFVDPSGYASNSYFLILVHHIQGVRVISPQHPMLVVWLHLRFQAS
jgi:hypothetical protein